MKLHLLTQENSLLKLGQRKSIIFDVLYDGGGDKGSLQKIDEFGRGHDENTWASYELKLDDEDQLISVEFERGETQAKVKIHRWNTEPEEIVFESSQLEIWFPSPDDSEPLEVVTIKELSPNVTFEVKTTNEDRGEIIEGKTLSCTVEVF